MSEWLSTVIAAVALLVSVGTAFLAYRDGRKKSRMASVTAYFHWNREKSRVDLPGRRIHVGYNLVVWNQGPSTAFDVHLEVRRPGAAALRIASIEDGEFPLARIDSGGRYPVQFAPDMEEFYDSNDHPIVRRFDVVLRWVDGNGGHEALVPLRRGQADR